MSMTLDLNKNVAELCGEYPELKQIMSDLGFKDITKPLVLNTMGRMMTIPKGAAMKEIPLEKIVQVLRERGFELLNLPGDISTDNRMTQAAPELPAQNAEKLSSKELLLKDYIRRLTNGEDLDTIKEEFRKYFSNVSAVEIARAEQTLLKEGTPLSDVQRLCDVHSALFHGATTAERIANAEVEVDRSAKEEEMNKLSGGFDDDTTGSMKASMETIGHPLQVLTLENHAILALTDEMEAALADGTSILELNPQLKKMTTIAQHYGKKDELMFPLLKDVYGYPGPSDVMWGVEDEIRDSLRQVLAAPNGAEANQLLSTALKRIREMVYKEENILFPLCIANFTEEDWYSIARDMPMFGPCMIESIPTWEKATAQKQTTNVGQDRITLPGGSMSAPQLRALLNALPMEITLIDENDVNLFFNEGEKLFTRPTMAIGRKVYSCHPKRVEPMVRLLIHEFKTGKKDSMHIFSEKCGKQVLINYYALRDEDGSYLGTMEAVQEMDGIADVIKQGKKGPVKI